MQRTVTLGDGRRVTLGAYVAGIKQAKACPDVLFRDGINGWGQTGREVLRQFRAGMHDRITQAIPYVERGREAGSTETAYECYERTGDERLRTVL